MNFRNDINALRAIAVIAVVIFHFNSNWLSGGFAGVDIFFVISGFLMTSIVFKKLDNSPFFIIQFYIARANRIIPALAFLCLALLIFGWFFLYNSEYQSLGKHIRDSLYFISNHTYWLESGYFDAESHEKWLLHTWSLSTEWQFYILYPVVLFLLSKAFQTGTLKLLILLGTILGLVFCIFASFYSADAAYFLLPTRAWQMLLGGVAFLYPIRGLQQNSRSEIIGWSLILGTYLFISDKDLWPGYLSLLPVLGTFLIIQSNNVKSKVTNNIYLQKIGLWSYSIYLWHWPVVVFIHNFIDDINLTTLIIGILASVLLGFISFTLIEKTKYKTVKFSVYIMVLAMSTYVYQENGINTASRHLSQSPINDFVLNYKKYGGNHKNNKAKQSRVPSCSVSKFFAKNKNFGVNEACLNYDREGGVFLWGDSHLEALAYGIYNQLTDDISINQITSSGCPSSFNIKQGNISKLRRACDYANSLALTAISKIIPDTVIIANKDNHQEMDWEATVNKLKQLGVKQVILMGPVPQWYPSLPLVYAKNAFGLDILTSNKIDKNVIKTNNQMLEISQFIDDLVYVDVINEICKEENNNYSCRVIYNDVLLAYDYGHLTREGAMFITREYILKLLLRDTD